MKKRQKTQKILAVYDAADEIEQVINELRNIGLATRSTVVDDHSALEKILSETQFDLMVCMEKTNNIDIKSALKLLKDSKNECPIICITENTDFDNNHILLKSGVTRIIAQDEELYLHLIIKQELTNHQNRIAKLKAGISLQDAEKRCRLLLQSSRDAIAYIADGMHILVNDSYVNLFDYEDSEDIAALPILDMVHGDSIEIIKKQLKEFQLKNQATQNAEQQSTVLKCITSKGDCFDAQMELTPATYEGEDCIQLVMHKIVEQVADLELQKKLTEMSKKDLMTGLANRQCFEEELASHVEIAAETHKNYVLFYAHLDQLSQYRSQIGVHGIDIIIKDMANILRETFPEDSLLARFGEDTYTALLNSCDLAEAEALGNALCTNVRNHLFDVESQTIQLTISIGLKVIDDQTESSRVALGQAFSAYLTAAEDKNGDCVSLFSADGDSNEVVSQTTSAAELQKAIDNNLFKILFQPIINLRGDTSEYYEVLLRRVTDEGKLETPEPFLATAESAKVATIVDRWVILQSVKALITRRMEGSTNRILINLTSQSLQDKTFLPWLSVALKATRLPDQSVTFQVTEQDANKHLKRVQELAEELKDLKCSLSISRFGNSENSENILKHVEVDYIKMDPHFTQKIEKEDVKAKFTAFTKMAQSKEIATVASFVESASTLSVLWMIGVDYVQGYYLQAPMETMEYDFSQDEDL